MGQAGRWGLSCSVTSGHLLPSLGPGSSPGLGNDRIFLALFWGRCWEIREASLLTL